MKKVVGVILAAIGIVMFVLGVALKVKGKMSLSIIGGADGPTSIFVAGKVGSSSVIIEMIAGIVLLAAGIFVIVRKK